MTPGGRGHHAKHLARCQSGSASEMRYWSNHQGQGRMYRRCIIVQYVTPSTAGRGLGMMSNTRNEPAEH